MSRRWRHCQANSRLHQRQALARLTRPERDRRPDVLTPGRDRARSGATSRKPEGSPSFGTFSLNEVVPFLGEAPSHQRAAAGGGGKARTR
jgi:hypothetical protein